MTLPVLAPMTVEDLDDILPLERQVFTDAWTRRMYFSDITNNPLATYRVLRPPPGFSGPERQGSGLSGPGVSGPGLPVGATNRREIPRILAWGGFWLMMDEAHIATIAAHPDYRGCGLGQYLLLALMDAALARGAQVATLEVRAGNTAAQGLYHKLGYEIAGRRRRYYRDGEDGLIMTLLGLPSEAVQARLGAARIEAEGRMAACLNQS